MQNLLMKLFLDDKKKFEQLQDYTYMHTYVYVILLMGGICIAEFKCICKHVFT